MNYRNESGMKCPLNFKVWWTISGSLVGTVTCQIDCSIFTIVGIYLLIVNLKILNFVKILI
jgi:hypothetical protein